jgi:hypothetical protein
MGLFMSFEMNQIFRTSVLILLKVNTAKVVLKVRINIKKDKADKHL